MRHLHLVYFSSLAFILRSILVCLIKKTHIFPYLDGKEYAIEIVFKSQTKSQYNLEIVNRHSKQTEDAAKTAMNLY